MTSRGGARDEGDTRAPQSRPEHLARQHHTRFCWIAARAAAASRCRANPIAPMALSSFFCCFKSNPLAPLFSIRRRESVGSFHDVQPGRGAARPAPCDGATTASFPREMGVNEQRLAMVSGLRLLTRNPRYAPVRYGYSMLHLEQASTFGWAKYVGRRLGCTPSARRRRSTRFSASLVSLSPPLSPPRRSN